MAQRMNHKILRQPESGTRFLMQVIHGGDQILLSSPVCKNEDGGRSKRTTPQHDGGPISQWDGTAGLLVFFFPPPQITQAGAWEWLHNHVGPLQIKGFPYTQARLQNQHRKVV